MQMPSKPLFQEHAYQQSCTATVVAVTEHGLVLDQTVFYPLVVLQHDNDRFSVPVVLCCKAPCAGNGRRPWPAR
jgi:hypothetical protein